VAPTQKPPCGLLRASYLMGARYAGRCPFPKKGRRPPSLLVRPRCSFVVLPGSIKGARSTPNERAYGMHHNLRKSGQHRPLAMRRPLNGKGNAKQNYQRYLARAREAQLASDMVEMENNYQHAEHYFRLMRGTGDE
jgi:hypothetical protein